MNTMSLPPSPKPSPKLRRKSNFRVLTPTQKYHMAAQRNLEIHIQIQSEKTVRNYNENISESEEKVKNVSDLKSRFKIEARHRFLNLLKSSYAHQLETGFAGKQAFLALVESLGKTEDMSMCKGSGLIDEWANVQHVVTVPNFMRRLYHVPYIATVLRHSTFQFVSIAFDVATSFIYAHRKVERDFCELMHNLECHYEDETLRNITQEVSLEILEESRASQRKAQEVLDDIHESFPEIARAVAVSFLLIRSRVGILTLMKNYLYF